MSKSDYLIQNQMLKEDMKHNWFLYDNEQLNLFDPKTLARTTDPNTSKAAAQLAKGLISAHESIVFGVLENHGSMISEKIVLFCELDKAQISKRTAKLKEKGLIRVNGKGRTKSGRWADILEIVK